MDVWPPIAGADEPRPHDHLLMSGDIATYLAACGATQDPLAPQVDDELPAVFLGNIPPEPDRAVGIIGPWEAAPDSMTLPKMRFMIVQRSAPWDLHGLHTDSTRVHRALQRPDHTFDLTAHQRAAYCMRVVQDPPVQDDTNRWIRVTTYEARLMPPR